MSWMVVLGCSTGTGAAVTRSALHAGFDVFGIHRGNWPDHAAALQEHARTCSRRLVLWEADASTVEAVRGGMDRIHEVAGPGSVRMLVHSIASASVGTLAVGEEPLAPRQLQATFDRMAHSFVWWTQGLVRSELCDPDGTRFLALSNLMPEHTIRGAAAIAASKAALETYVKHLAFELGGHGHRVNALKFAMVVTEALQATFPPEGVEALVATMTRSVPAGRLLDVDEVGRLCVYLAGDEASWFNGAVLDYTGSESLPFFDTLVYGGPRTLPGIVKDKQ